MCVAGREDFTLEKVEQESQARFLFEQAVSALQSMAHQNSNVVDKMKLMQIGRKMVRPILSAQTHFHLVLTIRAAASGVRLLSQAVCHQPLEFAVMVKNILRNEKAMINLVRSLFESRPRSSLSQRQEV